ncbi:MAG: hypothetical protein AAB731_02735 [Patescibacteria group bacterium]
MPSEKIGPNTPLELTPDGFVRPRHRGMITPRSTVFTAQELLISHRVTARGDWRSCTILMKGMTIEETRVIGQEGSADFNVKSRDCGLITDWLAEHNLFLETKTQAPAMA